VDDRLDLTGDEDTVGKTLGRDLSEGKTTLPVILWLASRPEAARADARTLVEGAWDDAGRAADLARRLASDGALAAADGAAAAEIEAARAALAEVPSSPARDRLVAITTYVLSRTH
jgi:octaprenyl-diphosphate synthase